MTLSCQRCAKRLSRKTARLINGEVLCSPCMFGQRDSGGRPLGETSQECLPAWVRQEPCKGCECAYGTRHKDGCPVMAAAIAAENALRDSGSRPSGEKPQALSAKHGRAAREDGHRPNPVHTVIGVIMSDPELPWKLLVKEDGMWLHYTGQRWTAHGDLEASDNIDREMLFHLGPKDQVMEAFSQFLAAEDFGE